MMSATPSRLFCRRGRWALELTRLVPVDNHVLMPKRQRVEGSEAILSHLKRAGDSGVLAQGAAQIMRTGRSDEERAFDAIDGEWVPSQGARQQPEAANDVPAGQRQDFESALAELRAEILILRGSHQRLKDRVVALEAELANVEGAPRRAERPARSVARGVSLTPPRAEPVAVMAPSIRSVRPAPMPFGDQPTLAAAGHAPQPPAEASPPSPLPVQAPARAPVAAAPPGTTITLGADSAILESLADLFGGDPGYQVSAEPLPDSALELAALYASLIVNDDGHEVGAVLADIRATASLGGRLSGLPASVIEEQAKTGVLSEAVTSAMSEVCNSLSAVLSRVPGNGQVRARPIETFPAERLRWVGSAKKCLALEKRRAGVFWIVTR